MKGYATVADVAAALGDVTFTPEQELAVADAITAAEAAIDADCGQAWLLPSPTTERLPVYGDRVYLSQRPVAAVLSVQARRSRPGATWVVRSALTDYELLDPEQGLVLLGPYYPGVLVEIVYEHPGPPVPAGVAAVAVAMAAGFYLQSGAATEAQGARPAALRGVRRLSVGSGDLALEWAAPAAADGAAAGASVLPADWAAALAPYRRVRLA